MVNEGSESIPSKVMNMAKEGSESISSKVTDMAKEGSESIPQSPKMPMGRSLPLSLLNVETKSLARVPSHRRSASDSLLLCKKLVIVDNFISMKDLEIALDNAVRVEEVIKDGKNSPLSNPTLETAKPNLTKNGAEEPTTIGRMVASILEELNMQAYIEQLNRNMSNEKFKIASASVQLAHWERQNMILAQENYELEMCLEALEAETLNIDAKYEALEEEILGLYEILVKPRQS